MDGREGRYPGGGRKCGTKKRQGESEKKLAERKEEEKRKRGRTQGKDQYGCETKRER